MARMSSLAGRMALVLGGTGQVGEGIVRALLGAGAAVAVASRDNDRLSRLHDRLPVEWDGRYVPIHGDIGTPAGARAVRDRVEFVCGRCDIVVTSIGGWWQKAPLIFSDFKDWETVVANNLTPHYLAATTFLPLVNKRPGSSFLFVTGAAADVPVPNAGLMSVASHAQVMLMRVLASEHRHEPVRINTLLIGTPVISRTRPDGDPDWLRAEEDVGRFVARLVSPADATKGEIIRLQSRAHVAALLTEVTGRPA